MKGLQGQHPLMILFLFALLGLSGAAFWVSLFDDAGIPGSWGGCLMVFYLCWKAITGE